jgi:hypothetical protein
VKTRVVIPPSEPLVSVSEAKAYLRVTIDAENALLSEMIEGATRYVEGYLERSLVSRTLETEFTARQVRRVLRLPQGPVEDILTVERYEDGAWVAAPHEIEGDTVVLDEFAGVRHRVQYVAGYGAPEDVPQDIRQAVLLTAAQFYHNRAGYVAGESIARMPVEPDALLAPYRDFTFYA